MSGSINRVTLLGNVGKDPEIRRTNDGRPIANFSIATSESWRDKTTGEKKEKTEWTRVVVFNEGLCGVVEKYVTKGSKLYVEGKLRTRKWTDKDGVEKYSTEVVLENFGGTVVLLGDRRDNGARGETGQDEAGDGTYSAPASSKIESGNKQGARRLMKDDLDDQIPFAAEFR